MYVNPYTLIVFNATGSVFLPMTIFRPTSLHKVIFDRVYHYLFFNFLMDLEITAGSVSGVQLRDCKLTNLVYDDDIAMVSGGLDHFQIFTTLEEYSGLF